MRVRRRGSEGEEEGGGCLKAIILHKKLENGEINEWGNGEE